MHFTPELGMSLADLELRLDGRKRPIASFNHAFTFLSYRFDSGIVFRKDGGNDRSGQR
jgi:hypothetical protein